MSPTLAAIVSLCCLGASFALVGQAEAQEQPQDGAVAWADEFFPVIPWDPQHGWKQPAIDRTQGLETIAECNFTMAGFVLARDLPECERLGLKAIMFPEVADAGVWTRQWRGLSDEQIDERVRTFVAECGDSEAILGYYIMDEPGAQDFAALGKAVAAVKKHAPGKLAYINLYPNHASKGAPGKSQLGTETYPEHLERFVAEVNPQMVSYDNYMVQYSLDTADRAKAESYYTNLVEARSVSAEHGLPFWNIVSSNQIRPYTTVPSPANLLLQAYTTLAAGGRSVGWYKYYSDGYGHAPVDGEGRRTVSWQYLQMVNRQLKTMGPMMNTLTSTGVFFTADDPPGDLPRLPGQLVTDVGVETPVMVGEFRDADGALFAMLVNLSLERSVRLTVETSREYAQRSFVSPESGELLPVDDEHGLWLTAGQGLLVKFFG